MLNGNVQILHDLRLARQHVDQLVGHLIRIEVVDAHPDDPVDPAKLAQQLRELALAVEVNAVAAGVLRHDDQLLRTAGSKLLCLLDQLFHRAAAVSSAQRRNDAERAVIVAALRDLQVRILPRRCKDAPALLNRRLNVAVFLKTLAAREKLLDGADHVVVRAGAEHTVYLGQFL